MYFLCMKTKDSDNKDFYLVSEENANLALLVEKAETLFEILTQHNSWDRSVIDNNFDIKKMSDAGIDLINEKINDFEWSFDDKYGRKILCYITSNL